MNVTQKEALWSRDFIIICLVNFFIFSGFQMFPAALSPYLKSLGASDALLGWVVGIGTITTVVMRPFAGAALDRFGRKWVFIVGLVVMIFGCAGHFIPSVLAVFFVRGILGLGFGVANTASNTVATDNMPRTRFGEGMGFFSLFSGLALAISPALALSMPFYVMFTTATALVIVSLLLSLTVHYKPVEKPAAGAAKRKLFEKNAVLPACVLFCVTSTYGAVVTFLALYAAEKGIENIGIYFTTYAVFLVVTRPSIGRFIDRRGFGAAVVPGLAAVLIALLIVAKADNMIMFIISAAFFGMGQGTVQTSTQTMAVAGAPKEKLGAATATFFIGFDAGVGAGSVIAGLMSQYLGYGNMYMSLAVFPVIGACLFLYDVKRRKKRREAGVAES